MARKLKILPEFWRSEMGPERLTDSSFDFRRIWKRAILLMLCVALVPLMALAYFDYRISRQHLENEILLRTDRIVSNTKRNVSFFLEERKAALQFIVQDNSFAELDNDQRLNSILQRLSKTIGGFIDLGLFDSTGRQVRYIGPYDLKDRYYGEELWFQAVLNVGSYISDVYLGFREEPHMVIAVRKDMADGTFFILRATLNTATFNDQLVYAKESAFGDSFLINHQGVLQTPSLFYGEVLDVFPTGELKRLALSFPLVTKENQPLDTTDWHGRDIIMGYSYIPYTSFILLVVGNKDELMRSWYSARMKIIAFLLGSSLLILLVIPWVATSLVNDIYHADLDRTVAMREAAVAVREAANAGKLASIGRLAAGVAHEINNPLAIINEKAGLLGDLLSQQAEDDGQTVKMLGLIDSIQRAVERCASITHRLLDFARPGEKRNQAVDLQAIITEVLEFFQKEAEHRDIDLQVQIPDDLPPLSSDRNKLQQVFLNLISNAFAALADGDRLRITVTREGQGQVQIVVSDNGHGISEDNLQRIFEPFYTTKSGKGGTGLGLFITHGLVNELHGKIWVESTVGRGTDFYLSLPLQG
ncbi:sensor histidine kinase [Desulfobulbus alkaliphilus]|uniref:sensor histidine kinase n=1 Tax=Desulfobulbus alkaliphilus TaxID=869814 RepID=UPI001964BFDB|nr:PAS domain-containing sensor histidine kinase [Desulfobulbus alkaliphilus]MBM9537007.1 ATP-binding protein [Desulfobulbus alkaliphilus]